MPIYTHLNCPIRYAGVLTDGLYRRIIVPVDEGDNVSVSAMLVSGAWSTSNLRIRKSNFANPLSWNDYSPHIDVAADGTSALKAVEAGYICLEVTNGQTSDARIDVSIFISHTGR